jgi:hypothetical protein
MSTYINPSYKKKVQPLRWFQSISLGCDPEFFFADRLGQILGSEKVMKSGAIGEKGASQVVIDGVQAELNPLPSSCREQLAHQISICFQNLQAQLGLGVVVKVDPLVEITQVELDSLSEGSKVFGCAPSINIYDGESKIKVDPKKYLKRSAGGHLHLGNYYQNYLSEMYNSANYQSAYDCAKRTEKALKNMPDIMVPILDIVVGNTCVMLDRFEGNKERRANYGRVGEYRVKPYGIEYRSLSNFWLRSYPLMSFVTGLARFAVHLVEQSTPDNDYVKSIFDAVPREDIVKAVNTNDLDLAYHNFKKIEEILLDAAGEGECPERYYPIKRSTIKLFHHFCKRIKRKGLTYWFPQEPLDHWTGRYNDRGGWETFARNFVAPDKEKYDRWLEKRKAEKAKLVAAGVAA